MVQGSEPYEPFQNQNLEDDLATIEKSDSGRLLWLIKIQLVYQQLTW